MFANFACALQRKTHRLLAILERMGIDGARLRQARDDSALLAATRTCVTCREDARCDGWLACAPAPAEAPPPFCPNAALLAHQAVWPSASADGRGTTAGK